MKKTKRWIVECKRPQKTPITKWQFVFSSTSFDRAEKVFYQESKDIHWLAWRLVHEERITFKSKRAVPPCL